MSKKKLAFFAATVACCGVQVLAASSLLLHLKLDEGNGTVAKDSSGRGHDATLVNPTWEEFGQQGKALRLNGQNAYIELPAHEDFDNLKNFTFSLWFKAVGFPYGMSLFGRGNYNNGWNSYVFRSFIALAGRQLQKAAVLYTTFSAGTQPIQPFYHLVITGEPSQDDQTKMAIRYYVNGKLRSTREGLSAFVTEGFLPSPKIPITIGKFSSKSSQWFNGILDEMKCFNRTLTADEIAAEYNAVSTITATSDADAAPELKPIVFPPLQKKRLAIYDAPPELDAKPVRTLEWFEEQAKSHGLTVTRLNTQQLSDHAILSAKNFDTLLLPVSVIPFDGEDTIFQFLAQGGCLLTATIVPSVFNLDANGAPLRDESDNIIYKQHGRGWFAPFLVRHLDGGWPWAVRKVINPLTLHPALPALTGDCLPAVFPADPKIRYTPADAWNNAKNGDGCYGGGANYAQAADLKVDLYREPNGIGADFIAYRYYNNLIFGSTFVELGKVGQKLLQSKQGAKIFQAALHLLESPLPSEQPESYYRAIITLNTDWARFGFVYFDTVAALRDAALFTWLNGQDIAAFNANLTAVEERFQALSARRKAQQLDLFNRKPAENIAATVQSLLTDVAQAEADFQALQAQANAVLAAARVPKRVPVKHKYGTLPAIASLTLPTNLSRLRWRLFETMRDIGVNVYSGPFHDWYAADPKVRASLGDIFRDHKFVYSAGARNITGGGIIRPADGAITERDPIDYPFEAIRKHIKNITETWAWKGKGNFRIGTADETGLGYQYWGEAAAEDLRQHLQTYYGQDIDAMNKHCGTAYKSFADIKLPTRQPTTPAEHAVWEHWRRLRETKLESLYANFYQIVKEHNPDLDVFHLPSTGAAQSPLYGVNYYNVTKHQDVSGIDGTCCAINREWLYLDLTIKRYLTSEWGGLYNESPVTYVNSKLWEELSGGALGFEHHVWSFGSDSVSFVDTLDMPRVYGHLMRMTLRDARKIDHVVLDGKRADPEIGILFSQTARVHDQGWGWAGEKTVSTHIQTVSNYYELFLNYHRSARVIAEEMFLEDKMPPVAVLFVPQARFLAPEVQAKLLDYAHSGGIVVTEGRIGEFDNFGQPSDAIFQALNIVPAFADTRTLTVDSVDLALPEADSVFTPAGVGDALANFGSTPAALSASFGKGRIVVLGFNPGLHRYAAFPAIIENFLGKLGLTPRFIVSDPALILREWRHAKDTYLLLTSRANTWALQETEVKVRGKVVIEDYLFGKNVKTEFRDGYTCFTTPVHNGARIFRIPGRLLAQGAPADYRYADARQHPPLFTLADVSGAVSSEQPITLPFQGRLSDSTPLKYGDYVFSLTTLSSGSNAKVGDMYLTVTSGREIQKKHLAVDQDYFFRMREKIFRLRSSNNFYMFPFYCDLTIAEVQEIPEKAAVTLEKTTEEYAFANALIEFSVHAAGGAAVTSLKPVDEKTEQVHTSKKCFAATGGLPGPFFDQTFAMTVQEQTPERVVAEFAMTAPSQGQQLTQTIAMQRKEAGFTLDLACVNATQLEQSFDLRWHPELRIGNAADAADHFYIPTGGAVKDIPYRALNSGHGMPPSGNWAAIVDTRQKLAFVTTFVQEQVQRVYIWESSDFYTLEIFAPKTLVPPGQTLKLDLGFYLLRGLSGIDAWKDGIAVYADAPTTVNQTKPFTVRLEAASISAETKTAELTCELWKQGAKIKILATASQAIAFDLPVNVELAENLSDLKDGDYTLRLHVEIANGPQLTVEKAVALIGQDSIAKIKQYEKCIDELNARKDLTPKEVFQRRVELEKFRRSLP
ncbi:MAG TPA: beta-galactosidase [Lentisphaeria bacterium]|nr:beta-galactosidase [Lentisphaeria bacterium]